MLGPTAKLLSYDLTKRGYQAIDLGHIDSEYEWFQMKAESKVNWNTNIQLSLIMMKILRK